ncbi:hypothetical protein AB0D59_38460 [Streptomyces sp. NPDC048417]|uniref:hypothetical protein n=1 Tax=Streptomyces sp. NPDC048417 TaxID=3155387 RepID=UPI00341A2479
MIVALIIVCEVAFWVLLAAGLAVRYLLKRRRAGVVLLLAESVLELVLFVVTAVDLRNGAEPGWEHGLAALYIGFTVAYGPCTIRRLDGHAAHRLAAGAPGSPKPSRHGLARARHEGRLWLRTVLMAAVACALLQAAIRYVGDGDTSSLRAFQWVALRAVGLHGVFALTYLVWPKKRPDGTADSAKPESALPAGDPQDVADVLVGCPGKDEQ